MHMQALVRHAPSCTDAAAVTPLLLHRRAPPACRPAEPSYEVDVFGDAARDRAGHHPEETQ